MIDTTFRTAILGLLLAALAGCATTGGGGSGGSSGGSTGGSSGGGSGGVGGGVSLPGIPGGGLPGTGLPGTGLPGTGSPDGSPGGTPGSRGGAAGSASGDGAAQGSPNGTAEGSPGGEPAGTATTADERRAVLDGELDRSLGEFDKTLRGEQDRVAQERDSRAATAAGSAAVETAGGSDGVREARAGDLKSDAAARDAATAASQGSQSKGDTNVGGGSGAPNRGIPSGEDDDIVARRLRRAAEQETDPELKEKLWKEYVEYKRGAQGRS